MKPIRSVTRFESAQSELRDTPRTWLVTGVAGFIGSWLLGKLLSLDQTVVGLDNFSTGHRRNLSEVGGSVTKEQWARFRFAEGDIRRPEDCRKACCGVDYVLHQAALGSVPRSMYDPIATHANNVDGFLNVLVAARDAKVARVVYASSSSVYGDSPTLPKTEDSIGRPLSPYAATKLIDEIYAEVFGRCYGLPITGLRYFNVFGPRQDPEGAYAAVIPKWFTAALRGEPMVINGDGETSRDFCYVANVVQANLLAAATSRPTRNGELFNVAAGRQTTLLALAGKIRERVRRTLPGVLQPPPLHKPERAGDVRHSLADVQQAYKRLGYVCTHGVDRGLDETCNWYLDNIKVVVTTQARVAPSAKGRS